MSNSWSSDSMKKLDTLKKMYQLLIVQSLFWIEKELNSGPSALMLSTNNYTTKEINGISYFKITISDNNYFK